MEEALPKIGDAVPDVALVVIGLPVMSGIEGTNLPKESFPKPLVLVLTVYDDDARIFRALCAGLRVPAEEDAPYPFLSQSVK